MSLKKLTIEQANNELNTPQAYREFLIELNNAVVDLQANKGIDISGIDNAFIGE